MKAKQMLPILTILTICLFANAQEKPHCFYDEDGFEQGQLVYLFGDQVQLREAPTTESKVLKTLPIGMHMVVLEKHENSWRYKGMEHHFYKVDYKGLEGYILGGLLALEKKTINGITHLFGRAKTGDENYLLIRSLQKDGSFIEKSTKLNNAQFYLTELGNMDLPDVEGILLVDYLTVADSTEGGGIYLFQQENTLYQAARLSQVHNPGVSYYSEKFIFPKDRGGLTGKILLRKERGENLDANSNWIKHSTETRELVWSDRKLKPSSKS